MFHGGTYDIVKREEYINDEFKLFEEIVFKFLSDQNGQTIDRACFAFAGPIVNGKVSLTNLPWSFSEDEIAAILKIKQVVFINDFVAIGYGVNHLDNKDYMTIQQGSPVDDSIKAVVGAGTGLGVALILQTKVGVRVIPTEGGHIEFAPTTNLQVDLLRFMKKRLHRVSAERVVSGIGITSIYKFLRSLPEFATVEHPDLKRLSLSSKDFSADISYYAKEHRDAISLQALDIFIRCYGSFAGNIALTTLPRSGLYIAGGIAPKLQNMMLDGRFLVAYKDKGRMADLLDDIPIHLITNTQLGLIGAAYYAATLDK